MRHAEDRPTLGAVPTDDPVTIASSALDLARTGRFDELRERFAPQLQAMVTAAVLRASWSATLAQHGEIISTGTPVSEPAGPNGSVVRIPATFTRGELTVLVTVTAAGRLAGLQLAPAAAAQPVGPWQPPPYADPKSFDEQDVTVGEGPLAVPGTVSVPRAPGRHTAVVLLAGSGPLDRDETIGRNKPFKDIAWGLASRDVVVLRFDKATFAHRGELAGIPGFTLVDEYVRDAVAAVRLLGAHPAVDAGRIFVLGHSLGGTVAPRVATAEPSVAGLVIMAGGAQPLHRAMVRQLQYLASLQPGAADATQPAIDAMTRQADMVDSPDLSPSTPSADLPFGVPAAYWLDLRAYDPAAAAATLDRPILLLHGGRDYQSTVADDLARWRLALDGRTGVTIRVYEAANHLFSFGTGQPGPAEYEPAQHVDQQVVADLAEWLTNAG